MDFTTQLGGPIRHDKLFFFFSAQRFQLDTDPSGPATMRHEVSPRFNFKLTWQPTANDNFMLSLSSTTRLQHHRPRRALSRCSRPMRIDEPRGRAGIRLAAASGATSSDPTRSAEVKYTGWWGYYDLNPEMNKPGHFDDKRPTTPSRRDGTTTPIAGGDQVNASVSHYADKFGRHELKFGAEFERSQVRDRSGTGYASRAAYTTTTTAARRTRRYSYGYDVTARTTRANRCSRRTRGRSATA